jgi:hypothetical protein
MDVLFSGWIGLAQQPSLAITFKIIIMTAEHLIVPENYLLHAHSTLNKI